MTKSTFSKYYRIFFGFLGLSAIITEIVVLIGRGHFTPSNFFSYFTIESNILAVVLFIMYGFTAGSKKNNQAFQLFRGAVTLYMLMTGVIFAVLLAGIEGATLTAVPWDNVVLHYIIPIVVVLDWFIDPPKIPTSLRRAWVWLLFPLAYVAYSLVRGSITNWYPYPFLNPTHKGPASVIITTVILAVGVMLATWVLCLMARKRTIKA
jgi:hypothetical protein